jgi:hypothetical protein
MPLAMHTQRYFSANAINQTLDSLVATSRIRGDPRVIACAGVGDGGRELVVQMDEFVGSFEEHGCHACLEVPCYVAVWNVLAMVLM